ncbi:cysteine--tRNA ligase [Candidatus Nesciobacter abundans]|uniref:cysteine--tRNA ligase n=1 Tax=Candidatus Nesciobacter abundans TaxID=2601668 RepID=UPI00165377D5|nr:cysteine--tRNA ligase [Candidatus Nesciobacter abundans]
MKNLNEKNIHIEQNAKKSTARNEKKPEIKLFNTASKSKEIFNPISKKNVKIYACGPTVYRSPHVGNARSFVVFDCLFRLMKFYYPKVSYVRNVTDIDDKIIIEAKKLNIEFKDLTKNVFKNFKKDCADLNVLDPTHEPFATNFIDKIIEDIEILIKNGFAYVSDDNLELNSNGSENTQGNSLEYKTEHSSKNKNENKDESNDQNAFIKSQDLCKSSSIDLKSQHVFFEISKYEEYLKFSGKSDLLSGARIEKNDLKKSDQDFVLWKPSEDVYWESPWGRGRPGWHIECTTMSKSILGFPFDIHCGGQDLIFPHHTNEIAQTWGMCQKKCANYWIHNNFVNMNNEKMSKSIGNTLLLKDVLENHNPMVVRLFLLMAHYRHPMNWTESGLDEASNIYKKWSKKLIGIQPGNPTEEFIEIISDDLNTTTAIKKISKDLKSLQNEINKSGLNDQKEIDSARRTESNYVSEKLCRIAANCSLIGIIFEANDQILTEEIEILIEKRKMFKKEKMYAKADEIRDKLKENGISIKDTKNGTEWEKD